MVELVDTLVLGTSALRRGGSTPSCGTKGYFSSRNDPFLVWYYRVVKYFSFTSHGTNYVPMASQETSSSESYQATQTLIN